MTILQLFKFMCACLHGSKMRCGRFSDKSEIFATWNLLLYVEILHRLTKLKEKSEMNAVHETKEKNWVSCEDVRPNLLQFCNQSQARVQQDTRLFFLLCSMGFPQWQPIMILELTWCIQHVSQVMLKCCRLRAPHLAGLNFTWCDLNWC